MCLFIQTTELCSVVVCSIQTQEKIPTSSLPACFSATHVLTRMTKPICVYITRHGIRHTIFIDDGKVNGADRELLMWAFTFVLDTLRRAGFIISQKKTDTKDSVGTSKVYLGFEIDSVAMTVKAQPSKLAPVKDAVRRLVGSDKPVQAKAVASVIGKVISLEPALGPVVQLLSRTAQMDLAQAVEDFGWNVKLRLSAQAKNTLQWLIQDFDFFNGTAIKSPANATLLRAILDGCSSDTPIHGWKALHKKQVAAGDASDKAVCAYGVTGIPDLYLQAVLSSEERTLSSGHRELLTVKYVLEKKTEVFKALSSNTILWLTDSTNMVAFLSKGSTKQAIMTDILHTFKAARELNLRIIPVQVSRADYRLQEADHGSRFFDPDDWAIDKPSYNRITRGWSISIDLFSHYSNKKCDRFYSYGRAPHTSGVDAFSHSWRNETAWICPPTALVIPTLKKIGASNMKAILLVPAWPTASYWSFLFPDGRFAQEMILSAELVQPFIIRGGHCQNKLLQGRTSFPFLAVKMSSDGSGYRHRAGLVKDPMLKSQ